MILLIACQEDQEIIKKASIKGYIQKGPFINGSTVMIAELDDSFTATGKNFSTNTLDNQGAFSVENIALNSRYVQLSAHGFYFDEV